MKLLKILTRSTYNATQAFAPVFGTGRLSRDICPPVNSDFVSTRTFALFNNIMSAVKYCLSSASALNQILNSAWGVTLPEQKKVPLTIALSFAFLRMPGLFVPAAARLVKSSIADDGNLPWMCVQLVDDDFVGVASILKIMRGWG